MHNKFILGIIISAFLNSLIIFANDMDINCPALNPVKIETKQGLQPIELVKNNSSNSIIIIPAEENDHPFKYTMYSPPQQEYVTFYKRPIAALAAGELREFIEQSTGVKIPIITEHENIPENKVLILVGKSSISDRFKISDTNLQPEGFRIEAFSRGIAIIGAPLPDPKNRGLSFDGLYGVLYGTYDFLERFAGVRFYYPGEDGTVVRQLSEVTIPPISYTDYPRYEKRNLSGVSNGEFFGPTPDCTRLMLQYRCGGHGILGANRTFCHSPKDLTKRPGVPRAKYKGDRANIAKPCYGNPKTLEEYMQSIDDFYHQRGDLNEWRWGKVLLHIPTEHYIPFSPPDHPIHCKCKYCRNMIDWKAPFHREASRLFGKFVSEAAFRIKDKYPGKTFYILPYYNYTSMPKGLKLPDNVFAQVALMYGHSLYHDPKIKRLINEWVNDWSKVTGKKVHLYIYPMWPTVDSPFPYQYYNNLKQMMSDIKDKVNGIRSDSLQSWNREMPSTYCHFRLMWNPEFNVTAAIEEQTKLLYGPAAPHMQNILTSITSLWESKATTNISSVYAIGPYTSGRIEKELLYTKIIKPQMVKYWKSELLKAVSTVEEDSVFYRRINFSTQPLTLFFVDYDMFKKGYKRGQAIVLPRNKEPEIDGVLDDDVWQDIPEHKFVKALLSHVRDPEEKTTCKMIYTDNGISFGFVMEEPEMKNIVTKEAAWNGNSIELFLEFKKGTIYQLAIDSDGKEYSGFIGEAPSRREGAPEWKVSKAENSWTLEIFIPFSVLDAGAKFSPKNKWRANFCRNRVIKDKEKEWSRWQTTFARSHRDSRAFGELIFERK